MAKRRYKQIAKIMKWKDKELNKRAFVSVVHWVAEKGYKLPQPCYWVEIKL